jgi:hypothetical protein
MSHTGDIPSQPQPEPTSRREVAAYWLALMRTQLGHPPDHMPPPPPLAALPPPLAALPLPRADLDGP